MAYGRKQGNGGTRALEVSNFRARYWEPARGNPAAPSCFFAIAAKKLYRHMSRMPAPTTIFGPELWPPAAAEADVGQVARSNRPNNRSGMKRVREAYTWRSPWERCPWVKKRCGMTRCKSSLARVIAT